MSQLFCKRLRKEFSTADKRHKNSASCAFGQTVRSFFAKNIREMRRFDAVTLRPALLPFYDFLQGHLSPAGILS